MASLLVTLLGWLRWPRNQRLLVNTPTRESKGHLGLPNLIQATKTSSWTTEQEHNVQDIFFYYNTKKKHSKCCFRRKNILKKVFPSVLTCPPKNSRLVSSDDSFPFKNGAMVPFQGTFVNFRRGSKFEIESNTSTVNIRTPTPKGLGYDPTSNSPQLEDASVQKEILPKKNLPTPKICLKEMTEKNLPKNLQKNAIPFHVLIFS